MLFAIKIQHSACFLHFLDRQLGATSMQGNKKSNHLVKPTYDLIIPNEYILDLLSLPLFSVDLLGIVVQVSLYSTNGYI